MRVRRGGGGWHFFLWGRGRLGPGASGKRRRDEGRARKAEGILQDPDRARMDDSDLSRLQDPGTAREIGQHESLLEINTHTRFIQERLGY